MATSIFSFFSLIFFSQLLGASMSAASCLMRPCNQSRDYFSVKFPFGLPENQSDVGCSYSPNFTLSCSPSKQTLLHLPKAGYLSIDSIDYWDQIVTLTDPNGCLAKRFLQNFNLSGSAFSFPKPLENVTLYNCTGERAYRYLNSSYGVPCLSGGGYTVLRLYGTSQPNFWLNCTFIKSVSAPALSFNRYDHLDDPFIHLNLQWTEPQCQTCERAGGLCDFNGGCKRMGSSTNGPYYDGSSGPVHLKIILGTAIPSLLITMAIMACKCRRQARTGEQRLNQPDNNNSSGMQRAETWPTAVTTTQRNGAISMESHLGDGDALLDPGTSPCVICLSKYEAGDMLRTIMECNHFFHANCVDEWLRVKATCPVCRKSA